MKTKIIIPTITFCVLLSHLLWSAMAKKISHRLILILALIVLAGCEVFSQGNLQFNQVIFQNVTNVSCYQVPAGKVFKLEAVNINSTTPTINFGTGCNSGLIGSPLAMITTQIEIGGGAGNTRWRPLPIWLKAGTYVFSSSATAIPISGIEFNIVP